MHFSVRGGSVWWSSAAAEAAWPRRSCSRRRGARVTLDRQRERRSTRSATLRARGRHARARWPHRADASRGRSHRAEPRRAARHSRRSRPRARAGVPVIGEIELASRWLRGRVDCDHRHQGQIDDDDADGRMLKQAGFDVTRRRQPRHGAVAQVAPRPPTAARGRSEQLPARSHRHVPSVDRGAAQFFADHLDRHATSRPTRRRRPASSPIRRRRTGRWSTPTTRQRSRSPRQRARAGCSSR